MKKLFYGIGITLAVLGSGCGGTSATTVKVFKYDGSVQCGSVGTAVTVMAAELSNAGVAVICSQKGQDGLAHPTVCGTATGAINIYQVDHTNLAKAETLGFAAVSTLASYQDQTCK